MKIRQLLAILLVLATRASAQSDTSAYTPLWLYNGSWSVVADGGKDGPTQLTNHCAHTGLFFACEQVVNGKTGALVVFLPTGDSAGAHLYRTNALLANAANPGAWGRLSISGDHWEYPSSDVEDGKTVYWRTLNTFTGRDHIRYEIQRSADGKVWTTTGSGQEDRR